ncbi:MAG: M50 family metallopeptidase, partial [Gemmatimonadota bacterium]
AGYLGSLLWGVLLVMLAHARRISPSWILGGVGGVVVALTVVYVRSLFGVGFGILFGGVLMVGGRLLPALWASRTLLVLGLTSCLYAILDIKSDVLERSHLPSDAAMLAEVTGVPTVVWGVLWIVVAVGVSVVLFRWAWKRA